MRRLLAGAVLAALMLVIATASAQVSLTFDKSAVADGVWIGTVAGDVTGRLVTVLIAADQSQPVWTSTSTGSSSPTTRRSPSSRASKVLSTARGVQWP